METSNVWDPSAAKAGLFARPWRALTLGCIALVSMLAFEALAVTTAMPSIAGALGALEMYALAFGATLATSVFGMVVAGLRCDRSGPRGALGRGALAFAAGLALAGFAQDIAMLVVGRALLGFGSGQIGVALYVAVGRIYPEPMRPRIFAMFAAAWVVPALVGPAAAGLMVEAFGWRSVFLVVLGLLPLAWAMVDPALRDVPGRGDVAPDAGRRLLAAACASVAALLLHLLAARPTAPIAGLLATVAILGAACLPLLPAGSLRAGAGLPSVIALRGLLAAAFFTAEAFLPLWLQQHRAWSVTAAGIAVSAGALCWSLGSQAQARLTRWSRRELMRAGLALVACGLILLAACARWPWGDGLAVLAWLGCGLGIGLSFPGLSVRLLELSPTEAQGRNSAALQLADALATTAALALAGVGFARLHASQPALAFAIVFALAAALAVLALRLNARVWAVATEAVPD